MELNLFSKLESRQVQHSTIEYREADLENIRQMLPQLKPEQQEDVLLAEKRFQVGKGMMFTNATGTGKTFTGLGIIKRFLIKGKKNILVVVPTEPKCQDWVMEAQHLDIRINILEGVNDNGRGVRVTTYANYYQNDALNLIAWDLVIYDESHYLMQNGKGDQTVYLAKHKHIVGLPSKVKDRVIDTLHDPPSYEDCQDRLLWGQQLAAYQFQIDSLCHLEVERTKVVFLSATPFAYHKSIEYVDGCLVDINEKLKRDDHKDQFNKFLINKLGYQPLREDLVQIPEVGVDQDLLERELFEEFKELGVISTRVLELDRDYSRHFFKISNTLGEFINEGIMMWYRKAITDEYPDLAEVISKKYNYLYVNQLLECIKAKEIITRIKQHLALGRKVVLFHSYNKAVMEHPFRFNVEDFITQKNQHLARRIKMDIDQWEENHPDYVNLDLKDLRNAIDTIKEHFPDALFFNGRVSKKIRSENIRLFNQPRSGKNLIVVQSKAGREGISLHDKEGNRQRVLINLALPVAPTEAIQTEGRIYRFGVNSDAIFEYATLHTSFEQIAFAEKVASRSKTAENLAMGNLARDLETAFKEGYINADSHEPYIGQGIGGKKSDRTTSLLSPFAKAKTYYWKRSKKNSRTKSAEGSDYFATPEPLGMKMVHWIKPQPEEHGLEPSAGHGAIARFFPKYCDNIFIEPSMELFSEMSLTTSGKHECMEFEELHIINKFDFIVMNPPFGQGGKLAYEHIRKALFTHHKRSRPIYTNGFRMMAIVPNGPSMERYLEKLYEDQNFRDFYLTGEILLPSCVFGRAGTNVSTKIIRIEHLNTGNTSRRILDLSHIESIEDFFNEIENLDF